ncbi:MAG: sigma-70 family RNA polymerase sigma factor [Anaerolineae bacterium]|jgi:RNA polymerase sigma-70 factor (ECF subfamily)|nr:sigma-70 family RNA polymerase sigma factor [Anaerolineae bacterium]
MVSDRTNEAWLAALRGSPDPQAVTDLRDRLLRGLRYALKQHYSVTESDLEDFVQDALVRILDNVESFRGESMFTTWAQKIAIRAAFSELRRKRWANIRLQDLVPEGTENDDSAETSPFDWIASAEPTPEHHITQQSLRDVVAQVIRDELTDLQRQALVAVILHEMPIEEVARRMDTNRNALYKLLHDARQRLKLRLESQGVTVEDVLEDFGSE